MLRRKGWIAATLFVLGACGGKAAETPQPTPGADAPLPSQAGTGGTGGLEGGAPAAAGTPPSVGASGPTGTGGIGGGAASHRLLKGDSSCPAEGLSTHQCSVPGATCVYDGLRVGFGGDVDRPMLCTCEGTSWGCVSSDAQGNVDCQKPAPNAACEEGQRCLELVNWATGFRSCSCATVQRVDDGGSAGAAGEAGASAGPEPDREWICPL
jgi:hypothetical protein